jgi:hypothetical protein
LPETVRAETEFFCQIGTWTSFNFSASKPVRPGGAGAAAIFRNLQIEPPKKVTREVFGLVFLRGQLLLDLLLDRPPCSHLLLPLAEGDVAGQDEGGQAENDQGAPAVVAASVRQCCVNGAPRVKIKERVTPHPPPIAILLVLRKPKNKF